LFRKNNLALDEWEKWYPGPKIDDTFDPSDKRWMDVLSRLNSDKANRDFSQVRDPLARVKDPFEEVYYRQHLTMLLEDYWANVNATAVERKGCVCTIKDDSTIDSDEVLTDTSDFPLVPIPIDTTWNHADAAKAMCAEREKSRG